MVYETTPNSIRKPAFQVELIEREFAMLRLMEVQIYIHTSVYTHIIFKTHIFYC